MDERFFNFPIELLRPAFNDMRKVCNNIIDYSVCKHSESLNGSQSQRIRDSMNFFSISLCNVSKTIENGRSLIALYGKKPVLTGISKDLLFDYYKNEKTDFEIVLLLAFLAIKSILGKKSYCRITSEFLLSRMAGYASINKMNGLPEPLKKYQIRYHQDCLKRELKQSFGMKIYGRYTRGFYVSFSLSEEKLIREVEIKRKKFIEKMQKEQQKATLNKVLLELYQEQHQ